MKKDLLFIIPVIILFLIVYFVEDVDNITSPTQENLEQYHKVYTFNGYMYEIYKNSQEGYYVYYVDTAKLKEPLDFHSLIDLRDQNPYGQRQWQHVYVFNSMPDLAEVKALSNPYPYDISKAIQQQKPFMWLLTNISLKNGDYICMLNNTHYDLYKRNLNTGGKWIVDNNLSSEYCKTSYISEKS